MKKLLSTVVPPLILFLSLSAMAGSMQGVINQAVEDESRADAARERDLSRKPAEMLEFSGVRKDDAIR